MNVKKFRHGRVVLGDCLDVLPELNERFDIAICDAPYNIGIAKWDSVDNFYEWSTKWLSIVHGKLKKDGSVFFWGQSYRNIDYMRLIIFCVDELSMKIVNELIWCKNVGLTNVKNKFVPSHETCFWLAKNEHIYNTQRIFSAGSTYERFGHADLDKDGIVRIRDLKLVNETAAYNLNKSRGAKDDDVFLDINSPNKLCRDWWDDISNLHEKHSRGAKKKNVSSKNEKLSDRIALASTIENGHVLIPFGGTGSEVLSCLKNKRRFLVIEKDKEAYEYIVNRIENFYENQT
jgi:DNA modification methylase